ncbi:hypothetical protein A2344_02720 [Candidatus Peregrinibacteria bacterium RIFOXYB12_FULL_41_12]|nr:MAG: hypothetical protein A2244_05330 [Candidatus Peregrinibacteria bacterium RIFOXYA2_FULL_41_18]OGJ48905.1 MAG: hypothetical protein A2344_02720 [Candidatus Peregrinibacteria bacterium RIFOXYB12_FULL_41_12]OGJ53081.1 MAG: hypothetical protein A2336_05645 [Candidatus Peregrinibacteria bacterium RIFOXYB2_FULL_41_88]OGJ53295.1 MAG: hypothetical protein A2448_01365 [Candidatus Peregrinibacteria bacterium RIFOXYC2_FULL_41_22]
MAKKTSIKQLVKKFDTKMAHLKRTEFYRIDFPPEGEPFDINEALAYEISPNWAVNFAAQIIQMAKVGIVSVVLFFIFFLLFNAPAYYQILKNDILNVVANVEEIEVAEPVTQELIVLSKDPVAQKQEFGTLALEVTAPDNRIVIPSIGKNVPIVEVPASEVIGSDWTNLNDKILEGLKDGVVRYPGTARPGEEGNVFITGHSSYYLWDEGQYKDVFALLSDVEVGDEVIIYYNQQKYVYTINEKKEVSPSEVDVLEQPVGEKRLTLMTCTPVGTNLKRLVLIGEEM